MVHDAADVPIGPATLDSVRVGLMSSGTVVKKSAQEPRSCSKVVIWPACSKRLSGRTGGPGTAGEVGVGLVGGFRGAWCDCVGVWSASAISGSVFVGRLTRAVGV